MSDRHLSNRISWASALVAVASFSMALACHGCDAGPNPAGINTGEAVALPGVKVDLPPAPNFSDLDQPQANADGTMTVFGLRKGHDKYLGKETKVKAYLLEVYSCPVCPKKQTCKLCEQPHFFVGDKVDTRKEKALMVVDYLAPKEKPPILTIGKQYPIEGTFAVNSPNGFASSDGLLVFTRMTDDKNVEFISPAAQAEAKAIAGENSEAAQMAKATRMRSTGLNKKK